MPRAWAIAILVALIAVGVALSWPRTPAKEIAATTTTTSARPPAKKPKPRPVPVTLDEHRTGSLSSAVQDAAGAPASGGRILLAGGLTAADTSRDDIRTASAASDRLVGRLPTGIHDTAAVRLGANVYVFGGGTAANTQSDEIVRVPASGGAATVAGTLPSPSSDQSAAAVGDTAYVVGGYTGSAWLDTIVAWISGA